jgi:general secretion pathway protein G
MFIIRQLSQIGRSRVRQFMQRCHRFQRFLGFQSFHPSRAPKLVLVRMPAQRHHREAGFTLIEIMVVIAIIGILATLIVPNIMGRPDEARATAAKHDVGTINQALKLYRLDIGRYPTTEQGLKALVERPTSEPIPQNWKTGGYLSSVPKDPWGNPYQYSNPGTRGEIDVISYGADGKPGGTGTDADIGNW